MFVGRYVLDLVERAGARLDHVRAFDSAVKIRDRIQ